MRLRKNRHFILLLLSFLTLTTLRAQTLYWVNGSGNFNDPNHWSLTSGGAAANQVPNSGSNVMFDDNSGKNGITITLGNFTNVKSFNIQNSYNFFRFLGASTGSLNISGSFKLSKRVQFKASTQILFTSTGSAVNSIDFDANQIKANVSFGEGIFDIMTINVDDSHTLTFGKGKYIFDKAFISAGNIINDDGAQLEVNDSYFKAPGKFKISNESAVKSQGMYVIADLSSTSNFSIPSSVSSSKTFTSVNSINAICPITISLTPSCNGPCTGVLTVSLSPSCTNTPYNLQVTNTNTACVSSATALSASNIPAVYTVTNACQCNGTNYVLVVRDGSNVTQVGTNTVNFIPNSAIIFDSNTNPQCSYTCDGELVGSIIGTSPFSVTVLSSGTTTIPSFTTATGDYSITSVCPGTYTFVIVDASGCVSPVISIVNAPGVLLTNAITSSIVCNGVNSGSLTILPQFGTPNYTVSFSSGLVSNSTGTANPVSATNLAIGPISATVTDSHGCTTSTVVTITQPAFSLAAVYSQTNLTCNGICIGAASTTLSGGTTPYTYSWSPNTTTASTAAGLCAGTKTLNIFDFNGCTTSTQIFTITQPSAITLTASKTNVVCSTSCTGVASISAIGGQGSYTYTWVGPLSTNTISAGTASSVANLCAGNYTVFTRDIPNNCLTQTVITITQPPTLSISVASQSISCFGYNNGSATVTASGGNLAPFTYVWSPTVTATSSVVTGLSKQIAPTPYTVTAFDASNCPISATFAIQEPTGINLNLTTTSLSCNAICNGSITGTPTGGIPPYSYTLANSQNTTLVNSAPPYNNICAANYTFTLKDNSNCSQTLAIVVAQPGVLSPSVSVTPVSCFNGTNGALSGNTGNGGSSPYTTYWSSISGTNSANPLNNQPAGTYTFHVIDSHSCIAQATGTVLQPPNITVTVNSPTITCFSVCNGVFTSTVGGGTAPYSYTWTNASNSIVSTAATASNLCPGSYTLLVVDFNLCTRTVVATVYSPPAITSSAVTASVSCFGDANGSATVTAGGGTPSYTYQFNSSPTVTNTTGVLIGQLTGTYSATINDLNGCVRTQSFNIGTPQALASTITGTGSCNVCTGSITLGPTNGTGAYTYSWTSSLGGSFPATSTLSNLCPGVYTATIKDSKNCTIVRSTTLTQIITVTVNLGGSSILCNGVTTGSAVALAGGGVGNYTYSWTPTSPVQTGSVLTGVGAGTYIVKVTDQSVPSTCSHTASIVLTQPPSMTITTTQTNVSCYGFANGAISATVTGGTPGTPAYQYSWSAGSSTTNVLGNITASIYTLTVKDGYNCSLNKVVTVTQPSSITINFTKVNPSGCTSSLANGNIQASASGGSNSGYSYTLNPVGTNNVSGTFTGLGGGAYTILVKDGAGCSNSTVTTLSPPSAPTVVVTSTAVACNGYSTGIVSAIATGSTSSFTFVWTPAVPNNTTNATTTATNLPFGVYVVTATDGNGCVSSAQTTVTQAPAYTLSPSPSNLLCNNVPTGSIVVAPSGGTGPYTYSWVPTNSVTGQGSSTVTNLAAGVYTLNLNDTHNCLTPFTFTITQPPAIVLSAVTSSLLCYNACTGSIVASSTGGAGFIAYSWAPVAGTSSVLSNLCAASGTAPIIYTLTATDANTCIAKQTFSLTQPSPLTNSINVLSATCSNSCNAVATQTASGGTSGYSYTWSSNTITAVSLSSLCAGIYTAYVTDANSCVTEKQFTVTAPAPLSVTLTPFNPLCNSACNGSISTAVSGAQGSVNYVWSPTGTGQNPTGLCATFTPSPTYTLVATDGNSCRVIAVVTLTNPPALMTSVSYTNPLCSTLSYTSSDGLASAVVSNAVGVVNYTWLPTGSPTKTTQTISGLTAGTYSLFIKDANNCQATNTFALNNPPTFSINTIINPASCAQFNGSITAIPVGGTPGSPAPYTYSWTGVSSTSSVVTGISAGVYSLYVNDSHACTASLVVSLSNGNGPSTMPLITNSITCNAQCTGAASVNLSGVVGGTQPYTASWTSPTSTNPALTNLCAGSYIAKVVDATGCIGFTTAVISEPPPIINTPTIGLPLCPGICNGSITVGTTGGNTPYTYSWIGVSSTSSIVTNLCAGDYTVVVSYNGVCTDTTRLNLPDQSSITIVPRATNVLCFGGSTGSIDLTISGGTSPYSAGWSNGNTGYPLNNITAGTYTAVITDNNGCSNVATASVTEGVQIVSNAAVSSPSCGLCNGSASVTTSGGTSPFTYNWSNSAISSTVNNLCAGIYQLVVTDNLACAQTQTVIINNSNGITGENFNVQQIPCSGSCVGAATVTAVGGSSPVSYSWINPVNTTSIVSGLCPGNYFVQMSDANGCIRIASVTINPQITLTVSPFVYLPFCTLSNGSISLTIAGGTPSYNVVWSPSAGQTTSLTGLNAGMYSYTVTESGTNSCSISNTINLSNSNGPVISATQNNISCFNACTGSISATATGTNTPLTYLWSNASTSPTLTNLCKGPITLTVTDFGGCKSIESFTLSDNPALQLGLTNVHNSTCFGDCNGSINLIPNGGIAPYSYTWTLANANTNPITALCDGVYSGTVTDSKGCTVSSSSYTIQSASALSLTANTFSSSCSAVADGSIGLSVQGGQPDYTYTWNGPSSFTSTAQNLINIYSGTYSVNVLDDLGCSKSTTLEIIPSLSVSANAGDDKIICPTTGTVLLHASSAGGSSSYKWFDAKDLQKTTVLANGDTYLVKNIQENRAFVLVASSSVASCYSEDQVEVDVYNLPPVDAGRDQTIPIYSSVTIGGHPSSFSAVSLTWSPALYLDDASISNPVASNTINVTYTLTVSDVNGCMASDTVQVLLYPQLNVTSGFTPNGDGKNDTWIIDYIDQFPATTVEIFNRWGDSIFSSSGYFTPFDGKYKGAELPVGTYYYIIKLNHPGYPKPITGPLTIFR